METPIPVGLSHADSRIVRQINMHSVFALLRTKKQLRVSEIAHLTGLSGATVKYLLQRLMEMRLISPVGEGNSTGGRKPTLYALNVSESVLCGVEVRIDRITVGMLNLEGTVLWKYSEEIAKPTPSDLVRVIERIVRRGVATLAISMDHVIGTAVCVPGFVDDKRKTIILDINMGLKDVALGEMLQNALAMPVFVIEEANAWLLAEAEYGAIGLPENVVFLLIGSALGRGIGGAIMLNGAILSGSRGFSGEIGHMSLDPEGPGCTCGRKGCWEALGSVSSLVEHARPFMKESAGKGFPALLRELVTMIESEDSRALPLFERFVAIQAEGIANLIHILNPASVVIGGEIALFGELFMEPLRERVLRLVMEPFHAGYSMRLSTLAENNALLGAVALLIQKAIALRQENIEQS
jgi:predicted NBD/HSP70 family sugar kinase